MLPFLIDMANLYEQFVAEWLKANTPKGFFVKQQHRVTHDQTISIGLTYCCAILQQKKSNTSSIQNTKLPIK